MGEGLGAESLVWKFFGSYNNVLFVYSEESLHGCLVELLCKQCPRFELCRDNQPFIPLQNMEYYFVLQRIRSNEIGCSATATL